MPSNGKKVKCLIITKKVVIDLSEVMPISVTPNDLEYKKYGDWIINEIVKSFNIPYSIINSKDSSYNNAK